LIKNEQRLTILGCFNFRFFRQIQKLNLKDNKASYPIMNGSLSEEAEAAIRPAVWKY